MKKLFAIIIVFFLSISAFSQGDSYIGKSEKYVLSTIQKSLLSLKITQAIDSSYGPFYIRGTDGLYDIKYIAFGPGKTQYRLMIYSFNQSQTCDQIIQIVVLFENFLTQDETIAAVQESFKNRGYTKLGTAWYQYIEGTRIRHYLEKIVIDGRPAVKETIVKG